MSATETSEVDIRADLQNEDETGYAWSYLERAVHPQRVTPGATIIAGNSVGRCLAKVIDIADGPGGTVVHLDLIPGSVNQFLHSRGCTTA